MTAVFLKILELSLTGSFVILVVLLTRIILQKSPKWCSYALWSVVFLRLILPIVPETDFSLVPGQLKVSQELLTGKEEIEIVDDITPNVSDVSQNTSQSVAEGITVNLEDNVTEIHLVSAEEVLNGANSGIGERNDRNNLLQICSVFWLAGVVCFGSYHIMAYMQFKAKVKGTVQVSENVYEISGNHISFVMGIFKPIIYISDKLDEESRKVVLCHEQVHLNRKDYLIKPAALAVACIHWFNPLVWLSFYLMSRDCEISCDEKVVSLLGERSKKIYSYTLLDEAAGVPRIKRKSEKTCAVLSFGEDSIKARIKHVLQYKKAPAWVVGISAVVLLALAVGLCSDTKEGADSETTSTEMQEVLAEYEPYQKSAESVLEGWAQFFIEKDAEALRIISADKEAFDDWDMINSKTENGYSFGYSSPWPIQGDYKIHMDPENKEQAEIYYFMRTSAPEKFVAREIVKVTERDGSYFADHQEFVIYDHISTKEEFMDAYVQQIDRALAEEMTEAEVPWYGWVSNTGYNKAFMKAVVTHIIEGTNPAYYDAYKDPVTAAKLLLHLGEGSGEITDYLYTARTQMVSTKDNLDVIGEGTIVNVRYTFEKDKSTIDIPMVLAEECHSIWTLSAGDLSGMEGRARGPLSADEAFMARKVREEYPELASGGYIQVSDFGIYRTTNAAIEYLTANIGAYYTEYDFAIRDTDRDGNGEVFLYYLTDSSYTSTSKDWWVDSICEIDTERKSVRYLPFKYGSIDYNITDISVGDGYIQLIRDDGSVNIHPLPDAAAVWNGKNALELNETEKNEYGAFVRADILEHKGEIIPIGNRFEDITTAIIDLNGDGKTEEIYLEPGSGSAPYYPYDSYVLRFSTKAHSQTQEQSAERLVNEIYAYSPDGERIFIALEEDGASHDPKTTFFKYYVNPSNGTEHLTEAGNKTNASIREPGSIGSLVEYMWAEEDGILNVRIWENIVGSTLITRKYRFNEEDNLEEVSQDLYELFPHELKLRKPIELHVTPDSTTTFSSSALSSNKPKLMWIDQDFRWICLDFSNEYETKTGWIEITAMGEIYDEPMEDWFEGIAFSG